MMNIFWMTLLAGIGLTMAASFQFRDLRLDSSWQQLSREYDRQSQISAYQFHRIQIERLKSEDAYLGPRDIVPKVDSIHPKMGEQEERKKESRAERIHHYPMGARLPLASRLYQTGAAQAFWQQSFWQLLDQLYSGHSFYQVWRSEIEAEAFFKELFLEIARLSRTGGSSTGSGKEKESPIQGLGSAGLSLVHFEDPLTQRVWLQMLRGSDRLGSCYPSLLSFLWPSDLVRSAPVKLNLPYAHRLTLIALLGADFEELWQERVDELKRQLLSETELAEGIDLWILDRESYLKIFDEVTKNLGIDQALKAHFDFTAPTRSQPSECLIRRPGLPDQLVPMQTMQRR